MTDANAIGTAGLFGFVLFTIACLIAVLIEDYAFRRPTDSEDEDDDYLRPA